MKIKIQKGVGLVEVLVALLLLGIAVLGFVALQVKAVVASEEAAKNVQAINLARDLSERIRMNRNGLSGYKHEQTPPIACDDKVFCSPTQMAAFEYRQIENRAIEQGMEIQVHDCKGVNTSFKRKCVYVSWAGTLPIDESEASSEVLANGVLTCTNGTAYNSNAKCVIMEVYNYA